MGVMQALKGRDPAGNGQYPPEAHSVATEPRTAACLNCGAALIGPFCANCGQRDIPPYPSVRELAVDAFWELSGWDGRFAATVRALVRRPGTLTLEFLEGRRARYLSPLRLYLLASLAYFLIAAAAPNVTLQSGKQLYLGLHVDATGSAATASRSPNVLGAADGALASQQALSSAQRDSMLKDIARAPALMRPFLRRAITDPTGMKRGIWETLPRMLFVLLPVFAAIVAVFYRGKKYPEHLYFAIHLNAFMFIALGVVKLTQFLRVPAVTMVVGIVAFVWIPVYATLAFRRVYGGSLALTLAKEVAIGSIYAFATLVAFIGTIYWVSIMA